MLSTGRLPAALLAVAFATAALAAPPAPPTKTPITPESVLAEMNRVRLANGLAPFRDDFRLRLAAEDRMSDMLELAYWSHQSPDGQSPFVFVPLRGYQHSRLGENLASGFETAEVLVASWMESKGHRENILEPDYADVGIAIIDGSTLRRAAGRSVVVIFGRELVASPIRRLGSTDQPRATTPPGRR
ncbi:MAG TPA: CAP domain-containing protein [Thermoanaerobaculia bacterium]|nr:CAP domain-containing protein [Thermoanaerobaculia bacterium]